MIAPHPQEPTATPAGLPPASGVQNASAQEELSPTPDPSPATSAAPAASSPLVPTAPPAPAPTPDSVEPISTPAPPTSTQPPEVHPTAEAPPPPPPAPVSTPVPPTPVPPPTLTPVPPTPLPPTPAPQPQVVKLKEGNFRDADAIHRGSGNATIYRGPDGSHVLRLEDFNVTNGPDLHVILSPIPNPTTRGEVSSGAYIDLGDLKGNIGNQNYFLPETADLSQIQSVVIYCMPFHVIFSVATLRDL